MPIPQLKDLAKKSGTSLAKIEKTLYPKAKKIADDMGKGDNYAYIYGILENMLGIEESTDHKELAQRFIESKFKSLTEYLYSLEEEITSSDITPTPEKAPKMDDDEEDEIDKKLKKVLPPGRDKKVKDSE